MKRINLLMQVSVGTHCGKFESALSEWYDKSSIVILRYRIKDIGSIGGGGGIGYLLIGVLGLQFSITA